MTEDLGPDPAPMSWRERLITTAVLIALVGYLVVIDQSCATVAR